MNLPIGDTYTENKPYRRLIVNVLKLPLTAAGTLAGLLATSSVNDIIPSLIQQFSGLVTASYLGKETVHAFNNIGRALSSINSINHIKKQVRNFSA